MNTKTLIKELDLVLSKEEYSKLKKRLSLIINHLKFFISESKIDADVFVGGSFAKGTIVKKSNYDIDIFIRFNPRYENLSLELEKIVKKVSLIMKIKYETIHGSRDYFRIIDNNLLFEIIPVCKINKPKDAKNVTDLSYFHVNYVKKKINNKIASEIIVAKTFLKANGFYGAESYINGFSGYAVECLGLYYKSFDKMLKELVKSKETIIIDSEKEYKNKNEVLINLNVSKTKGPIILVDPTWKERNVLAALSQDTFEKFKIVANEYLKNKKISLFEDKIIDSNKLKESALKNKDEFLHLRLITQKQAGDIAGTKLKKFTNFLSNEISLYFDIKNIEFVYDEGQIANVYISLSSKKEILKKGPPANMKEAIKLFKKANKNVFEEKGILYSKIKISSSAKRFIQDWVVKYQKKINEMDISSFKIIE